MSKVYAVERSDYTDEEKPIGEAENKAQAAQMIRKHLAEETGDGDTGITAALITYSCTLDAYFISD